jgi:cytochrome c553
MKNLFVKFAAPCLASAFVAVTGLAVAQAPAAAPTAPLGDAVAGGKRGVAVCSGCHGVIGSKTAFPEVYSVPKIGGQQAGYIYAALKAYKTGERANQTMKGLATALSDKDMRDVAAYYAADGGQGK